MVNMPVCILLVWLYLEHSFVAKANVGQEMLVCKRCLLGLLLHKVEKQTARGLLLHKVVQLFFWYLGVACVFFGFHDALVNIWWQTQGGSAQVAWLGIVTLALIWRKETNLCTVCTRDWSFSFPCCSCYRLQWSKLRSHGSATSRFRSVTWPSFAEDILCKVARSLACIAVQEDKGRHQALLEAQKIRRRTKTIGGGTG